MTKFNNKLFGQIIDNIVKKRGFFDNHRISTKTQLYILIGEKLGQCPDTVRGWRKPGSSGPDPRDPEVLKKLEKYLGLQEWFLLTETDEYKTTDVVVKENNNMGNITTTEFQKIQIMECYEAMIQYVNNMDIEDEEKFYELRTLIEAKKLALPGDVLQVLLNFLDDVVATYVFDDYTPEFTPDEAEYDGEVLVIKSEEASKKMIASFMNNLLELNKQIESFAERELKPYLWA